MRQPKPFYRTKLQCWYLRLGKKFIRLAKDEKEAWKIYHVEMGKHQATEAERQPVTDETPVVVLIGRFLSWTEKHKKPLTYRWYRRFLTSFVESIGRGLTVANLKTSHVTEWRDERYGKCTAACKRGAVVSVKRALNWAVEEKLIPANPVAKIKCPQGEAREVYISPEQWQVILGAVDESDPFRELLLILRETGCRPQEARMVECRHVDLKRGIWEFPVSESKAGDKSNKKRVVPLNNAALAITQRAVLRAGGEGRLFRNRKGQPFTTCWIGSKCSRLAKRIGFQFFAYAIRHSWITDALMRGVDPCTVAKMAGNSAEMVMNVYNQIHLNDGHMRRALAQATGETTGESPNAKRDAS